MNRVVITGIGIYSVLGKNLEEVRDSLFKGKSGIGIDPVRKEIGYRSALTGIIERPNLKGILDRRMRVGMAEPAEYAYMAAVEAFKGARIDDDFLTKNEVGIIFGNDSTAEPTIKSVDIIREKKDSMLIGSGSIFQSMNSTITMNLSVIFKLRGINFTLAGACASGSHSIGMGYVFIRNGLQNAVICGGAQEVNPYCMGSFDALSAFSLRENEPTKASCPFDRSRDGLVPSGGGAAVMLESYESAVKRGAPILGEILGYGFSSNGEHISQPNVEGAVRAMSRSIQESGIQASEIEYINAHATSTPIGDMTEAIALDKIFGGSKPLVSSTKSMTGHECWMAGASEVIYSMIMMGNDFIAPNINLENPDEHSAKLNIARSTIEKKFDVFLSNSFGFGGTNAALVIKKLKS